MKSNAPNCSVAKNKQASSTLAVLGIRNASLALLLFTIAAPELAAAQDRTRSPVPTAQSRVTTPLATAQRMKSAGAPATTVAREMRSSLRLSAPAATAILRSSGYAAPETARALVAEYRTGGLELYTALKGAGYTSPEVIDALDADGIRVDLRCIDPQGYPAPCGNFGGNAANPAMGQLTWAPVDQGFVNGTLTITGSNIPQVQVRIGTTVLSVQSASPTSVVARLPSAPTSGALTLLRVSDGVVGELDPTYDVSAVSSQAPSSDWPEYSTVARDAAVDAARAWLAGARIRGELCRVNAVTAVGSNGVFDSVSPFQLQVSIALIAAGASPSLAGAWDKAFREAWLEWSTRVTIPGLPLYPTFAAVPAAQAPPTPNVPVPLATLISSGATAMTPLALRQRLTNELGAAAAGEEAQAALQAFATEIGNRFALFLPLAQVMRVQGSGPVPSFAPPNSPIGPVVGGRCEGINVLSMTAF